MSMSHARNTLILDLLQVQLPSTKAFKTKNLTSFQTEDLVNEIIGVQCFFKLLPFPSGDIPTLFHVCDSSCLI